MNIGNYILDEEQTKVVIDESKHTLVVAGAGSGKTLTILGKINHLVNNQKIKENEILCISFTKAASESLKNKIKKSLNLNIPVYTFHKLALEILKEKNYEVAIEETLDLIIDEFFKEVMTSKKNIIFKYLKVKNISEYLKKDKEIKGLKNLISRFIHLFKANDLKLKDFISFHRQIRRISNIINYKKEKELLIIILNVYIKYQKYLKESNEIDFDDMLTLAKEHIDNHGVINNFKYIIIDEFQDTSPVRFNLIESILDKTDASLLVVGDDFQSIYKFTGCDLNLFINFKNLFNDAKILKIQNTYRNSNELIKVAGSFIMKNKEQITKNLSSSKHLDKPIEIIYYKNEETVLEQVISKIDSNEIMVLSRNNNDIKRYLNKNLKLNENKLIYKNKDITYLTAHKSKGLESENVIVLNMIDNELGFPSKIKDEKLLRLISPIASTYPYSEERRLFYVALTRTKNKVYLLTKRGKESIFIKELINNYKNKLVITKIN